MLVPALSPNMLRFTPSCNNKKEFVSERYETQLYVVRRRQRVALTVHYLNINYVTRQHKGFLRQRKGFNDPAIH